MRYNQIRLPMFGLLLASGGALAQEPVTLLCEYKKPIGNEDRQRYVLEIDLAKKWVYSRQYLDGKPNDRLVPFEVIVASETIVAGVRRDDTGRVFEEVNLNRLTAEASFGFLIYGEARHSLWNDEKKRIGGFSQDPVRMTGNPMQCSRAAKQF